MSIWWPILPTICGKPQAPPSPNCNTRGSYCMLCYVKSELASRVPWPSPLPVDQWTREHLPIRVADCNCSAASWPSSTTHLLVADPESVELPRQWRGCNCQRTGKRA